MLLTLLFLSAASAQNLTVTVPAGCVATPAAVTVTCGAIPPPTCPPGQVGTPPNCTTPPPPGNCPGFPSTLQATLPWTVPFSVYYSSQNGGFPANGALVAKFTTPSAKPNAKAPGQIQLSEFQGSPAARSGSLSATACDFVGGIDGKGVFVNTTSVGIYFWFSTQTPPKGTSYIMLAPATTYYLNVHNPMGCSPGPNWDVKLTLSVPQ